MEEHTVEAAGDAYADRDALSLGGFVAGLKAPREELRDRAAFLRRSARKEEGPAVAGLPLVGLGGSCSKPAFLLPYLVRFDDAGLRRLEEVATRFDMFVEYGAYPHLKLLDGREIAAVQDWTNVTILFLRPGYDRKEELAAAMVEALR